MIFSDVCWCVHLKHFAVIVAEKKILDQKVHSLDRLRIIAIKWLYPESQNNCNWFSSLVSNQISFFSNYLSSPFSLSTSYKTFFSSSPSPLQTKIFPSQRFFLFPLFISPISSTTNLKWAQLYRGMFEIQMSSLVCPSVSLVVLGPFLIVKWTKNQIFLALPSYWTRTTTKTEMGW